MKPKKKSAKPRAGRAMKFHTLLLNDHDILHLRHILDCEIEMQEDMMANPSAGDSPESQLEDWVIARDMKCYALRIKQMIDKALGAKP